MNQKTLTYILIIATLLLTIVFMTNKSSQSEKTIEIHNNRSYEEKSENNESSNTIKPSQTITEVEMPTEDHSPIDLPFHNKNRSEKNIKNFKKITYLETPDLSDFMMEDVSLDLVAAVSGRNKSGDVLTLLATKLPINPYMINALIKENPELFPIHDKNILEGSFTEQFSQKIPINGMKDIKVFTKEINGKTYVASYGKREDEKGTYGFVFESSKNNIDKNYDYLEKFFLKFKARSN